MKRLSPTILFESNHLSKDLARKSVRGGATTMTAQGVQFVLNIVGTIILARLLTPDDYGLVGMVTVVVNFAAMFKDAGLSMATVQKDEISYEQISTLFWLNVFISAFLGLCVLVCSPLVAWFYGRSELTAVTAALSISFIITGLTIQHSALLRRHMQFGTLAFIQITSYLLNIIVTIILALAGLRYWALVGGTIAFSISGTSLTLFFCPWLPGRIKKGTSVRDMLRFGGHLTGFNFVNYFARSADNILIGKFCGADMLGLYSKAYSIMMMPIQQIRGPLTTVAAPALSYLQNDHARFKIYYIKLVTLIAFITMPLIAFLFVCADELVNLLLGSQWLGAINIYKILSIAAFIQPVAGTSGLVMISLGLSKKYLEIGIFSSIVIVISFVIGLRWKAIGVALSYTIANYILLLPALWYSFKNTPVSLKDFFSAICRPALASIILCLIIYISNSYIKIYLDIYKIVCSLIIGFVTYILLFILIPGGSTILREVYSYKMFMFSKK